MTVVACGERWPSGALRPAAEDFLGAGAILSQFDRAQLSPEARLAADAYDKARAEIGALVNDCASGRELVQQGFAQDVMLAAQCNISEIVPVLIDGAFRRSAQP